jgi:hypothetical protein
MTDTPHVSSKYWSLDDDRDECTIEVRDTFRDVPTRNDKVCPLVLDGYIDGEPRSLWAWPTVLRNSLLEELEERGLEKFDVGERIHIRRGDKVQSKSHPDRNYHQFAVEFLGEADKGQSDEIPF